MLRKDLAEGAVFRFVGEDEWKFVGKRTGSSYLPPPAIGYSNTELSTRLDDEVILWAPASVTSLPYYTKNKIEAIDVIEAWGLDYPLGCVLKYLSRHGHKPGVDAKEDLLKARAYITRAINRLDGKSSWDAPGGANA